MQASFNFGYDATKQVYVIENESNSEHVIKLRCSDELLKVIEVLKVSYKVDNSKIIRHALIKLLIDKYSENVKNV